MVNQKESDDNINQTGNQPFAFVSSTKQENTTNAQEVPKHYPHHKKRKWKDLELQDRAMILLTLGIMVIAGVTGRFLAKQFAEMASQTQILATTAESDSAGASLGVVQTQKQLVFAGAQVTAAQKSADAIQRQTIEQERPWIGTSITTAKDQPFIFSKETGGQLALDVTISNVGHSVAKDVQIWSKLRFEPTLQPNLQEKVCSPEKAPPDTASDYVIFPAEIQPATIYATATVDETRKTVNDVIWNTMDVVVCVNYRGVLDSKLHQTQKIFTVVRLDTPNHMLLPNFWSNHVYTNEVRLLPHLKGNLVN